MMMQFSFFFFFDVVLNVSFLWLKICRCCKGPCRKCDRDVELISWDFFATRGPEYFAREKAITTPAAKLEAWIFRGYTYIYFLSCADSKTILMRGVKFALAGGDFEQAFGTTVEQIKNKYQFPGETLDMWRGINKHVSAGDSQNSGDGCTTRHSTDIDNLDDVNPYQRAEPTIGEGPPNDDLLLRQPWLAQE